ncbi:MAG TPA: hypothetical protein VFF15_03505 [Flavobacteriaceae bacterium]|nr:hypothetical protein [Flavobacteriaceae bacterium]
MKKTISILLLAIVTLTGCKNNSEPETIEKQKPVEDTKPSLNISFVFKTDAADIFKIMMNNVIIDEFQKKSIHFSEEVFPTSDFDEMNVVFDSGNLSKNIMFHLGNQAEKTIEIKSITITYGEKVFTLSKASDLNDYLVFNKFIEIQPDSKLLKVKKVEGQLYPSFSLRQKLINQFK